MPNDLKFDFEHLLSAIRDGEMPDGSDVNAEEHLDTLVEVLNALDPTQIENLMEATGGVAASHALAEALLGQAKQPEVEVWCDVVKSDKFSLSREVMKGTRSVEMARQAKLRKAANQNLKSGFKSRVAKRSIVIRGHKTSVSLEEPFWSEIKQIAERKKVSVTEVVEQIDNERNFANLSGAIRLFVLDDLNSRVGVDQPSSADGQAASSDNRLGADAVRSTSRADWN
jgi:predicted DNA-binding ribbon-helix-helix protein